MKGLNVKKIFTLASAALLIGAGAVAASGLYYENTMIVDETGAPQISIIVGEAGMAYDGVAAAKIAAKVAGEAYEVKTYSASANGGNCVAGEGETTEGTCPIMDETVTLSITSPGLTGAYEFNTVISDYIDREGGNRIDTDTDDDQYAYDSDTFHDDYNVFTDGSSASVDINEKALHMIGSEFTPFAVHKINHPEAGKTYDEEQRVWVNGKARWDDSEDSITADLDLIVYSVKFTGTDYGILQAVDDNIETAGDDFFYTDDAGHNDRSDGHQIKFQFLGDEWVIVDMVDLPTPAGMDNEDDIVVGGSMTIAKESERRIMHLQDEMDIGSGYSVRLTDIGVAETAANQHAALFDVIDGSDGTAMSGEELKIFPGDEEEYVYPGTSDSVRIYVYETTYGYELFQRWAEVAIFEEEWELVSGDELDEPNDEWEVLLKWKNKDAGTAVAGNEDEPDALREIVLYREDAGEDMVADEFVTLLEDEDTHAFTLTYHGLDLTEDDYDALVFELVDDIPTLNEDDWCGTEADDRTSIVNDDASYNLAFMKISSDSTNGLSFEHSTLDAEDDELNAITHDVTDFPNSFQEAYVNLAGSTAINAFDSDTDISGRPGEVYVERPSGCWNVFTPDLDNPASNLDLYFGVAAAGDSPHTTGGSDANIKLSWEGIQVTATTEVIEDLDSDGYVTITYAEEAGEIDSDDAVDAMDWVLWYGAATMDAATLSFSDLEFRHSTSDDDNNEVQYESAFVDDTTAGTAEDWIMTSGDNVAVLGVGNSVQEAKFITDRGTYIKSLSADSYEFDVANRVAQTVFTFSTSDTEASPDTVSWTGREGDDFAAGGVSIVVDSIDQTLGSCGSSPSGAASCSFEVGSATAVISETGTETVTVNEAKNVNPASLIKLDSSSPSGAFITVGGDAVNTVSAAELQGANAIDWTTESVVVKELTPGSKIIVAGREGTDTIQAAEQLIAALERK